MKPHIKKALAEAFAGLIPHRMERNRWRGLLRYGPWRVAELLHGLKHRTLSPPRYYLSVCAIAKNEGPYFREWIDWHRSQGVEKFYIYDNESTDDTAEVLAPYIAEGIVDYLFWPGQRQQIPAYDDCIARHRLESRWMAFIDIDEFVVPTGEVGVLDFLRRMESWPVVEVNWLVYGSGGEKTKREGGVMERFRYHSLPDDVVNRHIKSFVDPRRVCCMTGCHNAAILPGSGPAVDVHGEKIDEIWSRREPVSGDIRINHYAVKSYEEFLGKRARGRARSLDMRGMDYFDRFDRNDIKENEPPGKRATRQTRSGQTSPGKTSLKKHNFPK